MNLQAHQHHDGEDEYHAGDPEGHVECQRHPRTSDAEDDLLSRCGLPAVDVVCDEAHTDEGDDKANDPKSTCYLLSH